MDLSVVIPAHNARTTLGEQLDALCRQDWPGPIEILVVDNGSTDDTAGLVRDHANRAPPHVTIRGLDSSNTPGAPHARNFGAAHATADKLAFCDADDVVVATWVGAYVRTLDQHEFVCGPQRFSRINPPAIVAARPYLPDDGKLEPLSTPWLPVMGSGNFAIRKSTFLSVGGFDEQLGAHEDSDLSWRLALRGVPLAFDTAAILDVRLRWSLAGIYRQSLHYGNWFVMLNRRFIPHGMPLLLHSRKRLLKELAVMLLTLPLAVGSRPRLGRWAWDWGWRRGLFLGQGRFRNVAPAPL